MLQGLITDLTAVCCQVSIKLMLRLLFFLFRMLHKRRVPRGPLSLTNPTHTPWDSSSMNSFHEFLRRFHFPELILKIFLLSHLLTRPIWGFSWGCEDPQHNSSDSHWPIWCGYSEISFCDYSHIWSSLRHWLTSPPSLLYSLDTSPVSLLTKKRSSSGLMHVLQHLQ